MCQPGRPSPHGLGHFGSPGLAAFQSAKSPSSTLVSLIATRVPETASSSLRRESLP